MKYQLPIDYDTLSPKQKREVREQYCREQRYRCYYCGKSLKEDSPTSVTNKWLDLSLFPPNFLKHPIHLQHNHDTGMTEGAVHAYCNGVMWQYEGK